MRVRVPDQRKVVDHFGMDNQHLQAAEELGELIQAVSKIKRARDAGKDDTLEMYNLVEEVADVLVVIEQLASMYGISSSRVQAAIDIKCRRLEEKIRGDV